MSPISGVGINYAIQDAVAAANVLTRPLKESQTQLVDLDERYLAKVQRRRELPTRVTQAMQALVQQRIVVPGLWSKEAFVSPPLPMRLLPHVPGLRAIPARLVGFGVLPVRIKQ